MTEQEKCLAVCKAADEKKARDIVTMDMRGLMSTNDYFVICSANTATQVRAIVDNIEESSKKQASPSSIKKAIARASGFCSTTAIRWRMSFSRKRASTMRSNACGATRS